MFSGIVSTLSSIHALALVNGCKQFTIARPKSFADLDLGESIAINGVCLTVTDFDQDNFWVQVVPETLRLTNLDQLVVGDLVNLERAITLNDRIGGHHVQGHIDGIGKIITMAHDQCSEALLVKISIPNGLHRYLVNKGYVTLDGMSITVIDCTPDWFTVTFIGYTKAHTIVKTYQVGQRINIEVDILGKYVEKLLRGYAHVNAS